VVEAGKKVSRFGRGARVWAYQYQNPKGGFHAEYVVVAAKHVGGMPRRRLNLLEAGGAPVTGLTALQGIDDHLGVQPGETVLIFGATGAVGTLAVQFARWRGARVIGTASTPRAAAVLRKLGVDGVFDARKGADALRRLAPDGLDAALVLASGRTLQACLGLVRPGGRVAFPNGVEPEPRRRKGVRMTAYDAETGPRQFLKLELAAKEARLQVPVAAVFPLAQVAKAHARLEQGHVVGRIVLQIAEIG
jgi:NADPH:quinone reductase-like Zn-dependent oxidoreductase